MENENPVVDKTIDKIELQNRVKLKRSAKIKTYDVHARDGKRKVIKETKLADGRVRREPIEVWKGTERIS